MKKPLAALVLAKMKKAKEAPESEDSSEEYSEESDGEEGLSAAAEEVMTALEEKNPAAFASALKAFVEQC